MALDGRGTIFDVSNITSNAVAEIPVTGRAADGSQLRLLHVHAHPDDESSKGAATTARYVSEGVSVLVATCTGGERGSVLNPRLDRPEVWARISQVRETEMQRAREILGVDHVMLGFEDSGLPEGEPKPPLPAGSFATLNPVEAAKPLVKVIREYRPHVLTTYDEQGGYPHPDHIQCHLVSIEALRQAADKQLYPEFGPAWAVPKVYYQFGFNRAKFAAFDKALTSNGVESPYRERLARYGNDRNHEHRITTQVRCDDFFDVRDRALLAHETQIDPDSFWFSMPRDLERATWPTEEFQLVYSSVPVVIPEDDLFAGLRPAEMAMSVPDPARIS